ncbi:MAG TPA: hypothetical protein VFC90_12415 [Planctomycetota bacterium]|nr:hypothetical protein [Planctomycetota bacterium]
MKLSALPWILVPGFGQIRGGAPGLGVLLFTLFILALNGYFLTALLTADGALAILGFAAAALWLVSMIDGIRRLSRKSS